MKKLYDKGWFHGAFPVLPGNSPLKRSSISDISAAIEKQNKVQQVLKGLPRKECGVCGSPDCQTFAEDVIEGKAKLKDCLLLSERLKKTGIPFGYTNYPFENAKIRVIFGLRLLFFL